MKSLFLSITIFFAALYLSIRSLAWFDWYDAPFLQNYVADFCAMPVVLGLCLSLLKIIRKNEKETLPILFVLSLTLYWSFYFEWWLPKSSILYTADWWDVVAYFLGSSIFVLWQRAQLSQQIQLSEAEK